jgi:hypothetical protein
MTRSGANVTFYASEGHQGKWIQLSQFHLGPEDLSALGLNASTGALEATLAVRFTDLELRAESLGVPIDAPSIDPPGEGGWVGAGVVICLLTALLVLVVRSGARAGLLMP